MQQVIHTVIVNFTEDGSTRTMQSTIAVNDKWIGNIDKEYPERMREQGIEPTDSFENDLADGIIGAALLAAELSGPKLNRINENMTQIALRLAALDTPYQSKLATLPCMAQVDITIAGSVVDVVRNIFPSLSVLNTSNQFKH